MAAQIGHSSATWSQAVQTSQALLTEAERHRFGCSGPDDIVRDFQSSLTARSQTDKVQNVLRKIQPLVAAMERFGKPVDVIVNTSPEILSPAWGILRAVLIVARDYESYFSMLLDMLQQISDAIPGFHVYERVFYQHPTLRDTLSALYLAIITFLTKAKKVFSGSSFRIFGRVLWKPFEQTFQSSLSQMKRYGDLVEREAKLAHIVEEAQARLELARVKCLVEEQQAKQEPGLLQIKHWLQARQCDEERDGTGIVPSTCEWILKRPELSAWMDQETVQLFWLRGPPGCGKSFLYTKVLDCIAKQGPFVFFYFCGADNNRVTTSALLRSWTHQLAKIFPQAMACIRSTMQASENREAANIEVRDLFLSVLEVLPSCFLTVDAVDECLDRRELCKLLGQIPPRFKILIASRPMPDLSHHLRPPNAREASIEVTTDMTKPDVERYIDHHLTCGEQVYEPLVLTRIKEKLAQCDGMFLWVRLMLQHIQEQTSDEEILHCLDELPRSLSERYDRIMDGINCLPKPQRLLAHKVFFWMNVARRPLGVQELCALLAVRPSQDMATAYDATRRVRDPEKTITAVCGSLVTARGGNKLLYPIHFTVTEYLKDYLQKSNICEEVAMFYQIQQKSSDSIAAVVCLRYLSLDIIADHFKERMPSNHQDVEAMQTSTSMSCSDTGGLDALLYAANNWFQHMLKDCSLDECLVTIAGDLFNDQRRNMEISWRLYWFAGPDSAESAICPAKFSPIHVAAYFGLDALVQYLLPKYDPNVLDMAGRSALWWAVSRRHATTTGCLMDAGVDPNQPDTYSIAPLHRAAAIGDLSCFKQMMAAQKRRMDPLVDGEGWTALHWAAARGHYNIVEAITHYEDGRSACGTRRSRNRQGRTPLHLAALNGHPILIRELACGGPTAEWVNFQDLRGETALHLAAAAGHLAVIESLVQCHSDTTIRNSSGKTAADKALDMGNKTVVSLLAELSANGSVQGRAEKRLEHMIAKLTNANLEPHVNTFIKSIQASNRGGEVNSRDAQDSSLAHSIINGHRLSLTVLVRKQRQWNVPDARGRSLLHVAAAVGEITCAAEILRMLRKNIKSPEEYLDHVNQQDDRGWTALHYAAAGMFDDVAKLLLNSGAAGDIANHEGTTPYDLALQENHPGTVEALVRFANVPTPRVAKDLGWNEIHCKAHKGTITKDEIEEVDVSLLASQDRFGRMPMYRALEMGHVEVAQMILDRVSLAIADIIDLATVAVEAHTFHHRWLKRIGRDECAPPPHDLMHELFDKLPSFSLLDAHEDVKVLAHQLLVTSARCNDVESITMLARAGVNLDTRDCSEIFHRLTALQVAIDTGNTRAAMKLVDCGANVNFPDTTGYFPIHTACTKPDPIMVKYLLDHGADPDQLSEKRERFNCRAEERPLNVVLQHLTSVTTPFGKALEVIAILLDHGESPNVAATGGKSPIVESMSYLFNSSNDESRHRYEMVIDMFASRGFEALLQPPTEDGLSPIHVAASSSDIDGVKRELDAGVPVDWLSFKYPRRVPLHFAVEKKDKKMVGLLLEYGADVGFYYDKATCYDRNKKRVDNDEVEKMLQRAGREQGYLPGGQCN